MNKKGMTLIEMVVTLLILSIASLTLFGGFSAVISIIGNSGRIKNNSDTLLAYAEGRDLNDLNNQIEAKNEPINYSISTSVGTTIHVTRNLSIMNVKGDSDLHLKKLQKPDGMQKVKETEYYSNLEDIKAFYTKLREYQKINENSNLSTFNSMLKQFYIDEVASNWILFPNELLPNDYVNQLAGISMYAKPYYPWELMISDYNFKHGTLIIFLNKNQEDINEIKGSEYLHIIYDYLNDKWYYYSGDKYRLTFLDYTSDGKTLYDLEHNGYIKNWTDFSNIIKNPKNGWKVLDIEAEYNSENPDSMWKNVS